MALWRYDRDTESTRWRHPSRRGTSGSPLQASGIAPLVRTDGIRRFRPTADISVIPVRERRLDAATSYGARSMRAARALGRPASTLARTFTGSPIAHRDRPPNLGRRQRGCDLRKRGAHRIRIAAALRGCPQGFAPAWHYRFRSASRRPGNGSPSQTSRAAAET
jgi:hypothetical protein